MGHRNSPAQRHGPKRFRLNASGTAESAAESSSLRISVPASSMLSTKTARVRLRAGAPLKNHSLPASLLVAAIRFYQAIFAPLMPVGCKFYPSCSRYAAEAIERHGAKRGLRLALARLWRCRPFTKGGVDLVPDLAEGSDGAESAINEVRL